MLFDEALVSGLHAVRRPARSNVGVTVCTQKLATAASSMFSRCSTEFMVSLLRVVSVRNRRNQKS
jgi:hypothetical protein